MIPNTTILIVDDAQNTRRALQALLALCPNVEILGEASNGLEALDFMSNQHPAVVIMDVNMPEMNGIAATQVIKKRWPDVRVIMLAMDGRDRENALAAGADDFLIKGCPESDLFQAISNSYFQQRSFYVPSYV